MSRWAVSALALVAVCTLGVATARAQDAVLEVYVRDGCPHCEAAEGHFAALRAARPGLEIVVYEVDRDARARERLIALSHAAGQWPPGVPTFVVDGRLLVGFEDAERTGSAILALLDAARPADAVGTTVLGGLSESELGLPLFSIVLGLVDGFNPCATWVLLFLLSLLVRLDDRRRMAVVATTFVVTSGVVYYAFMAAWLNLFLWIGFSDSVRIVLAVVAVAVGLVDVKDFVARDRGVSLAIPGAAKPGLYARMRAVVQAHSLPASLGAVVVLALVVNFVELLCTAGLPALFTAVLSRHDLDAAGYYGHLLLYILGYVADDAVLVALAVTALGNHRLGERAGRRLKLVAGLVMLLLGFVMLLRPDWLA